MEKAFDKWLKEFYDTHRGNMHYHPSCEQGWRAALEYVMGEHGPLDERVHNCDCARGRIRKELEEE